MDDIVKTLYKVHYGTLYEHVQHAFDSVSKERKRKNISIDPDELEESVHKFILKYKKF